MNKTGFQNHHLFAHPLRRVTNINGVSQIETTLLVDVLCAVSRLQRHLLAQEVGKRLVTLEAAVTIDCCLARPVAAETNVKSTTLLANANAREDAIRIQRLTTRFETEANFYAVVRTQFCLSTVARNADLPSDDEIFSRGYAELCHWTPSTQSASRFAHMTWPVEGESSSHRSGKNTCLIQENSIDEFHLLMRLGLAIESRARRSISHLHIVIFSRLDIGVTLTVLWNAIRSDFFVLEGSCLIAKGYFSLHCES